MKSRKMRGVSWLAGGLLLCSGGLAAANEPTGETGQHGQHGEQGQHGEHAQETAQVKVDPKTALTKLHHINLLEIEAGKLATERSTTPAVKAYGERLVRDHQQSNDDIERLTREQNIELVEVDALPREFKQMRSDQKKQLDTLRQLQGDEFDRQFAQAMVDAHEKAITELIHAANDLRTGPVKELLDTQVPTLREHRDQALQILERPEG